MIYTDENIKTIINENSFERLLYYCKRYPFYLPRVLKMKMPHRMRQALKSELQNEFPWYFTVLEPRKKETCLLSIHNRYQ